MKILLDQCVPRPFRRQLIGHEVKTAHQMGWSNLSNGTLLAVAANAGFNAFLTIDQNVRFQQNLSALPLSVIVLVARNNDPDTLAPYAKAILEILGKQGLPKFVRVHSDGRVEEIA